MEELKFWEKIKCTYKKELVKEYIECKQSEYNEFAFENLKEWLIERCSEKWILYCENTNERNFEDIFKNQFKSYITLWMLWWLSNSEYFKNVCKTNTNLYSEIIDIEINLKEIFSHNWHIKYDCYEINFEDVIDDERLGYIQLEVNKVLDTVWVYSVECRWYSQSDWDTYYILYDTTKIKKELVEEYFWNIKYLFTCYDLYCRHVQEIKETLKWEYLDFEKEILSENIIDSITLDLLWNESEEKIKDIIIDYFGYTFDNSLEIIIN
jgi:hypothetical protein